jgi:hypothetical protein
LESSVQRELLLLVSNGGTSAFNTVNQGTRANNNKGGALLALLT